MIPFLDLTERRALITSGTRGAGAATLEIFRQLGASVLTTARNKTDALPDELFFTADHDAG